LSNIISKKITSSILLAIVLVAGTFVTMASSFFITGVNADQCSEDVESCFKKLLTQSQFETLSAKLASPEGIPISIEGIDISKLRSFEDLCSALVGLDSEDISSDVNELVPQIFDSSQLPIPSTSRALIECIIDAFNK
jgi:hypothetical protein